MEETDPVPDQVGGFSALPYIHQKVWRRLLSYRY